MRLYLKIFLWFSLAMLLVGGTLVVSIYRTQSELYREDEQANDRTLSPPFAERWAAIYERQDSKAIAEYDSHAKGIGIQVYLFSADGKQLFGQTPPPEATAILPTAMDTDDTQVRWSPRRRFVAQRTTGPSGRHYILVVELASPFTRFFSARPSVQALRLIVAAFLGGLFCLWLASYITAPVTELRSAARDLASGRLSSRVGKAALRRKDELADLGRDFNQMAERIESLMSSQRRLIQSVSHELRSPLARLNVALGLAYRCANPEIHAPLERIEREAGRLNQLVADVLKLSRWESGLEPANRTWVDLDVLVREIVADANFEAGSLDRSVCVKIADACAVEGVRELLHSAIENVIRNAVRYTSEGSAVEVTLERLSSSSENSALIRVRDHGPGVPEEALGNLFKPFYRVADARERASGGTGLGLAITEAAVRLHCGQVKAENSPEGGLVVEIRLPLSRGEQRESAEPRSEMQRAFAD